MLCTVFSAENKKRRKPPENGSRTARCREVRRNGQESIACGLIRINGLYLGKKRKRECQVHESIVG